MGDMTLNITRKHLESKPDLVSTVDADQPEEVFIEIIKVIGKPYLTNSSSTKCKYEKVSEIEDSLRGMHSSHMQIELSKQKLYLIQQQETLEAKQEQPKESEEDH